MRQGYITPTRVKIILALALADYVVRDADVVNVSSSPLAYLLFRPSIILPCTVFVPRQIFKTLHSAYAAALSNPFLRLAAQADYSAPVLTSQSGKNNLGKRVDEIVRVIGTIPVVADEQV